MNAVPRAPEESAKSTVPIGGYVVDGALHGDDEDSSPHRQPHRVNVPADLHDGPVRAWPGLRLERAGLVETATLTGSFGNQVDLG